jgi:Transposase.
MICLDQAVLLYLLGLKCWCVMMPSFARMDALQLDSWCSVFQSAKEVLVTSFGTLDFQRCAHDVFLRASQLNGKPREKPFLPRCWYVFKLRERPTHPGLLQQMKPDSVILNWRQKGSLQEWCYCQSPRKKEFKHFLSVGKVMITVFSHCAGHFLLVAMLRWQTVNFDAYVSMLEELGKCFK